MRDSAAPASKPTQFPPRRLFVGAGAVWPALLIAASVFAVYFNSFHAPFVFDDQFAILENPSIKDLSRISAVLSPPPYSAGAAGRPLVNLSLAIDYAISGEKVWSYHATNLAFHILASLTLFGLVRRTLAKRGAPGQSSVAIAFASSLVWAVHPLLTESVTCAVQRNEVMAGLFYLLTLYGLIRGSDPSCHSGQRKRWYAVSVAACLAGIASKEIVVSAPLIAFLYDRTFIAGTFANAWRERRRLYLSLAGSWIVLGALMVGSRHRGGTVGFGLGVSSWDYLLTQCRAIVLYLKLTVWPHPLVIDYGTAVARHISEVAPQASLLVLFAFATLAALRFWPVAGFLGASFFAILAPSSSIVPLVTQPIAEHRMYLPLAVLLIAAVGGLHSLVGRKSLFLWLAAAVGLGFLTVARNHDYLDEYSLIRGSLAADSKNDRAYLNLGTLYSRDGKIADAIANYEEAVRLAPAEADSHFDLAAAYDRAGRTEEAIGQYRESIRLKPDTPSAHYYLGLALAKDGRLGEAIAPLAEALRLQPNSTAALRNLALAHRALGDSLSEQGRLPEARDQFAEAVRLRPDDGEARQSLARTELLLGK